MTVIAEAEARIDHDRALPDHARVSPDMFASLTARVGAEVDADTGDLLVPISTALRVKPDASLRQGEHRFVEREIVDRHADQLQHDLPAMKIFSEAAPAATRMLVLCEQMLRVNAHRASSPASDALLADAAQELHRLGVSVSTAPRVFRLLHHMLHVLVERLAELPK